MRTKGLFLSLGGAFMLADSTDLFWERRIESGQNWPNDKKQDNVAQFYQH